MDLGLKGSFALVSGGTRGIGLAAARLLAEEGCGVALNARDPEALRDAAKSIAESSAVPVVEIRGDTSEPDEADRIVREAVDALGRIDILVASTGSTAGGLVENVTDDEWLGGFRSKFLGYVRLCRAVLPHMLDHGRGSIVLVVGNAGLKPSPWEVAPAATNAADISFASAIADQYASSGIRVNTVNPGPVDTDRWEGTIAGFAEARVSTSSPRAILLGALPLGRPCSPEEVAPMIALLASPLSAYITGAHVVIDGGSENR